MNSHPANDEIEISVFGPGIGESIVIHLGHREWVIIDSCCDENNKPVALEYLKNIGVDPIREVILIVSSHWHDDHIKGLSEIYSECSSARIACAVALQRREFASLVEAYGADPMIKHKGVEEFNKIFSIMSSLSSHDPRRHPIWAAENKTLLRNGNYSLTALSPSDAAISASLAEIKALLPQPLDAKRNLIMENPNHAAVAINVSVGAWHILLASDLQVNSNPLMGWSAIVNSKGRIKTKAQLLKIPHHGSINADSPELWSQLVTDTPIAIVTPYNRGIQKLPSSSDLQRISKKCDHLYYTNLPSSSMPKRRTAAVERTINETVVSRKVMNYKMGQVRLRNKIDSSTTAWKEDLYGCAGKYSLSIESVKWPSNQVTEETVRKLTDPQE